MITRILTYAMLPCILGVMGWYILSQRDRLRDVRSELSAVELVVKEERKLNEKLTEEKKTYVEQMQKARADLDELRNSDVRLRVRADCPKLPEATTDTTGAGERTAELDPSSRRAYFDLRSAIIEVEGLLDLCRAELKARVQ